MTTANRGQKGLSVPYIAMPPQFQIMPSCPVLEGFAKPTFTDGRGIANWGIVDPNGAGVGGIVPYTIAWPTTVYELAKVVQSAELKGRPVRAYGTLDSFSDAAFPLTSVSNESEPHAEGYSVDTKALNASFQCHLPGILRSDHDTANHFLFEAGMKLSDLNTLLDLQVPPRALPTLGGSSTQSFAGAISTGTHGMDFDRPPIADCVRALYIVGAGGTHYWVEGSIPRTDPVKLSAMFPCLLPENIHYSDPMLQDVLVSFGAMGIIYLALIETVPQYDLMQVTGYGTWEGLTSPVQSGGAGSDLSGAVSGAWTMRGSTGGRPIRALQVVINPIKKADGSHQCYVTNRLEVVVPGGGTSGTAPGNLASLTTDDIKGALSSDPGFDLAAKIRLQNFIGDETNKGLPGQSGFIQLVLDYVSFCQDNQLAWAVRDVIDALMERVLPEYSPGDWNYPPYVNTGYKVMANSAFSSQFPFRTLTSTEAFFDLPTAITYINNLLALFDSSVDSQEYPAGYVSLRLCGPSSATLGPQRFDPTACVEISLLNTDAAPGFIRSAEEFALTAGGILHWGQSNGFLFATNVANVYGSTAIQSWKTTQQSLGGKTFVNWFMKRLGLA